jgi:hypothetical protein
MGRGGASRGLELRELYATAGGVRELRIRKTQLAYLLGQGVGVDANSGCRAGCHAAGPGNVAELMENGALLREQQ